MVGKLKSMTGPCSMEYKYASAETIISRAYSTSEEAVKAAEELESYGATILKVTQFGVNNNE